mgnify:CR=1 FL=1
MITNFLKLSILFFVIVFYFIIFTRKYKTLELFFQTTSVTTQTTEPLITTLATEPLITTQTTEPLITTQTTEPLITTSPSITMVTDSTYYDDPIRYGTAPCSNLKDRGRDIECTHFDYKEESDVTEENEAYASLDEALNTLLPKFF